MITDTRTISSAEAAVYLWEKLGPLRAWQDFLSDCIRGRQHINGHKLMPCARKRDGRANTPMYSARGVNQFIKDVRACTPHAGPTKITVTTLAIDDRLPWYLNKFDAHGAPIGRKCSIYPARSGAGAIGGAARRGPLFKPVSTPIPTRRGGGLSAPYH